MDWKTAEREYTDAVIGETTLGRLFEDSAQRTPNHPAQMYKGGIYDRTLVPDVLDAPGPGEWGTITYTEMRDVVKKLAAGFRDLGVDPGDRVGIFADTRMEWAQSDFALLSAGAVITTVYPGSSPKKVAYLLGDCEASAVLVENQELLDRVLEVEDDLDLEFIVSFDGLEEASKREDIYELVDIYDRGSEVFDDDAYQEWIDAPAMDDLSSLIYTSGTTGKPKGVELTHRNFRSNVNQARRRFGPRPDRDPTFPSIDEDTRIVSFLPLAHVFERMAGHFLMFASGACVAYAESPDTLRDDFAAVEPTAGTSVPRVYEKIYDAIREQAAESPIKERIFNWAVDVGVTYQQTADPGPLLEAKRAVADKLVFSTVRDALGGNIELLISGGGSLSAELGYLYHAMGLPIYEGYGLTETSPVVTTNPPEDPKVGTIGPSVVNLDLAIDESAVEQSTFEDDPGTVGELLVRGPNVTDGYWNSPEATERAFTEDIPDEWITEDADFDGDGPWFRTGDIVHRRPDGYFEFRERQKQILVLSTGKNVAPAPIEDGFAASQLIEQAMVVGDGEKFVSAILVPNLDHVRDWAADEGIDLPADDEAVCAHDRVRAYVQTEVDRVNEAFEAHETIKTFKLVPTEFTKENELLTPTMKKKRRTIESRFDEAIQEMYAKAPAQPTD